MIAVYYSLATDPSGTRERQWARSVESLRRYNQDVSVVLCLYGGARAEVIETAGRTGVEIIPMGEFADALGDIPPHWRAALATFPTLHKLLSLRGLLPRGVADQAHLPRLRYLFLRRRGQPCHQVRKLRLVCPRGTRQQPQPSRIRSRLPR